jgi:phosphoglycolate phosphatase-like HAD superfamily hydrolase
MRDDMAGWLAANRLYNGVPEALRAVVANPSLDLYIVTTKQARFTHALLRDLGGLDFPLERIFSQTVSGRPKTDVLAQLQAGAGVTPDTRLLFVEDKLSTLEAVAAAPGFERWQLCLATWGYNTPQERERCDGSRIVRINQYQLPSLLGVPEAGPARFTSEVPWPHNLPK